MKVISIIIASLFLLNFNAANAQVSINTRVANTGFKDAASYGFSPDATGVNNVKALQAALDEGGTIVVSKPGVYKVSGTAYVGDNTSLDFGAGVIIQKSGETGVLLMCC